MYIYTYYIYINILFMTYCNIYIYTYIYIYYGQVLGLTARPEPFKVEAVCNDLAFKLQLPLAFRRDASFRIWG